MGIIPKITCRNCQKQFSGLMNKCPHCGTRRVREPGRAPVTTASKSPGTAAAARLENNNKWQLLFGVIILCVILLAVVTLIIISSSGEPEGPPIESPTPPAFEETEPPPTETPEPTPIPTPPPQITSIEITYGGERIEEFAMGVNDPPLTLGRNIYPITEEVKGPEVIWKSSNESILTVENGVVSTAGEKGWVTVSATCGAVTATCKVLVW